MNHQPCAGKQPLDSVQKGLEWEQGAAASVQQGKAVQHFGLRYRLNSYGTTSSLAHPEKAVVRCPWPWHFLAVLL